MKVTNDMIEELSSICNHKNRNRLNFAICKAINLFPNPSCITKELVLQKAKYLVLEDVEEETNTKSERLEVIENLKTFDVPEPKVTNTSTKKRGRKPQHCGKLVLGGTKFNCKSFWNSYTIEQARDDSFLPEAQPGGNYSKVKEFLRTDWKHKEKFKLPELICELTKKYNSTESYSESFRLQRWGDAQYWENTGNVAIKPLWKRLTRQEVLNVFYQNPV